jgi:prolyl oligopeptidase
MSWSPDTGALDEVVPPHERQTLKLARLLPGGHVLVVRSIDVRDQIQIFSKGGQHLKTLDDLPLWTILDVSYDVSAKIVFLLESSFCHPPRIWHARLCLDERVQGEEAAAAEAEQAKAKSAPTISPLSLLSLFSDPPGNTSPTLTTTQVFYPSLDSTSIPMFLTSASNPSPTAPILLYIYGGLGVSVIPHFRPDFLTFASPSTLGGIVAVANIRGGGEYGTQWHRSACGRNRQRVFDDIIAAAKFLRDKFTSQGRSRKIILMGESMGGLNAATAMTQAPDLFDAVILNAAVVDILHRQRVDRSKRGVEDLGDVNDPGDFDAVYQWSPMEKVLEAGGSAKGGVGIRPRYPPVLLTAGDKDDTVSYSNSLKMAAALQKVASEAGDRAPPTHLRIISNLGHGGNISARQKAAVGLERWLWVKKTLDLDVYGG